MRQSISHYTKAVSGRIQAASARQQRRKTKGKEAPFDPNMEMRLNIYVATSRPTWQSRCIELVRDMYDGSTLHLSEVAKHLDASDKKKAMPFVQELKRKLEVGQSKEEVLERVLGFDEVAVLREMVPVLKATVVNLQEISINIARDNGEEGVVFVDVATGKSHAMSPAMGEPEPGAPALDFVNL